MYRKLASALLVAGAIGSQNAAAVSLGEITMNSALNEPLDAVIKLKNTEDFDASQILVKLASAEEFEQAGIERSFFLSDIKFTVEVDGKGDGHIHLTSERRVNEPFIDILLEGRWPTGRMLRSYTVLVDLPVYKEPQTVTLENPTSPSAAEKEKIQKQPEPASPLVEASESAAKQNTKEPSVKQLGQNLESDEYFTKRADTLWVIAKKHTAGTDLTVNQTMAAIQQENPQAFINGNINLLKQGVVLRLPSEQEIRSISKQQANQTVVQQEKQWRDAQLDNKQVDAAAAEAKASDESGHLSLTSAGEGVVAGDSDQGEALAGLQQQLLAAQDEFETAQSENQELSSRVNSLSSQIEQLERLIELKDAELASLQQQLGKSAESANKEELKPSQDLAAQSENKAVVESELEQTVELEQQAASQTTEDKEQEQQVKADNREQTVVVKEKPAVEPSKKQEKPAEIATEKTNWLEVIQQNPIYIGLLGLLIAIGMGVFLLRRRAQDESELMDQNASFNFSDDEESEEAGQNDYQSADAVEAQDEETVEEELLTGDPIEEADVYFQFGRYQQAIDILSKAIANDASQAAVAAKLVEAYLAADQQEACQALYAEIAEKDEQETLAAIEQQLQNDEKGSEWLELIVAGSAVGAGLAAAELYSNEELENDQAVEFASDDTLLEELEADDFLDLDLSFDNEESSATVEASEELDSDESLDFDLDLDLDESADMDVLADTLESTEELDVELSEDSAETLELDDVEEELELSDSLEDIDFESFASDLSESSEEGDLDASLLEDIDGDVNFEEAETSSELDEEAELSLDDFDLDFDEFTSSEAEAVVESEVAVDSFEDENSLVLDTEDMNLELSDGLAMPEISSLDEGDKAASEESMFVDSSDEISTKLDLAQAYIEMGDTEGAKELLEEVLDEGNEEQKLEANELLSQLD